jgi:hypothetical protein
VRQFLFANREHIKMKQSGTDKVKVGSAERGVRELTKDELRNIVAGTGTNGKLHVGSTP